MRRSAIAAALWFAALSGEAAAQQQGMPHRLDTYLSRVEVLALIQTLNGALLASRSATLTLEKWCADHKLASEPKILLMDEPFAALDEQTRMTMGHELLRIWSQTAKTVVFVTHSLTEAVYLADEVLVMSARPGRIIDRIDITLPRPRTYEMMATDVFGRLRDRIWQQIRKKD